MAHSKAFEMSQYKPPRMHTPLHGAEKNQDIAKVSSARSTS
jgi:hypothetical protein